MLKLPSCLRVVQRRRVSRKLELLHHLLRAALFAFEQKRHVDLELNDLRRLILIAPWCLLKERVEALSRPCIIFFLKRNLREIILRLAEFRIHFGRLLKRGFRIVEFLLLHQNLAPQIEDWRLIRVGRIGLVDKFPGRREVALLGGLLRLFET